MHDVIPRGPTENNVVGLSHHTFYSSHAENCSVETVFTPTNVDDDTTENYSDYRYKQTTQYIVYSISLQ